MTHRSRLWTAWAIGETTEGPRNQAGNRLERRFWERFTSRMFLPGLWFISRRK